MNDDLELPVFLNRKLTPIVENAGPRAPARVRVTPKSAMEQAIESAWSEAEKDMIRERFAAKAEAEKELKQQKKRLAQNGHRVYLAARLENCPLTPGEHVVELVKKGRKWVRFRCIGRANCVKVRRVIWDAIEKGTST